VQNKQIT